MFVRFIFLLLDCETISYRYIDYQNLVCRYQTAKSNKNVVFPVRVSCNTSIIIWSLLIPSFVSSNSKLVEPVMSWKKLISFTTD